ncbi:hypothetical protein SARC_09988 [Sphaeroforma arctica JP610]|uniref:Uncharacterized protein n=1 Tax=Sphaeroforma arctica JP610 TaxID=667725 RepID=A0A0L0FLA7_9EUKA|nr:hypothetical protein SARC_09988 [Sphaeroforma arctica JP610]KNC77550.1 hypothetical protein SARC_09988 [Sphaeroforma arctica JP610]|eukprot:XP_014151452.1 hypothetical protein SARC_09988 [Sphaeroforma arctica JP610]
MSPTAISTPTAMPTTSPTAPVTPSPTAIPTTSTTASITPSVSVVATPSQVGETDDDVFDPFGATPTVTATPFLSETSSTELSQETVDEFSSDESATEGVDDMIDDNSRDILDDASDQAEESFFDSEMASESDKAGESDSVSEDVSDEPPRFSTPPAGLDDPVGETIDDTSQSEDRNEPSPSPSVENLLSRFSPPPKGLNEGTNQAPTIPVKLVVEGEVATFNSDLFRNNLAATLGTEPKEILIVSVKAGSVSLQTLLSTGASNAVDTVPKSALLQVGILQYAIRNAAPLSTDPDNPINQPQPNGEVSSAEANGSSGDDGSDTTLIIGISVGVAIFMIIVCSIVGYYVYRHVKRKNEAKNLALKTPSVEDTTVSLANRSQDYNFRSTTNTHALQSQRSFVVQLAADPDGNTGWVVDPKANSRVDMLSMANSFQNTRRPSGGSVMHSDAVYIRDAAGNFVMVGTDRTSQTTLDRKASSTTLDRDRDGNTSRGSGSGSVDDSAQRCMPGLRDNQRSPSPIPESPDVSSPSTPHADNYNDDKGKLEHGHHHAHAGYGGSALDVSHSGSEGEGSSGSGSGGERGQMPMRAGGFVSQKNVYNEQNDVSEARMYTLPQGYPPHRLPHWHQSPQPSVHSMGYSQEQPMRPPGYPMPDRPMSEYAYDEECRRRGLPIEFDPHRQHMYAQGPDRRRWSGDYGLDEYGYRQPYMYRDGWKQHPRMGAIDDSIQSLSVNSSAIGQDQKKSDQMGPITGPVSGFVHGDAEIAAIQAPTTWKDNPMVVASIAVAVSALIIVILVLVVLIVIVIIKD